MLFKIQNAPLGKKIVKYSAVGRLEICSGSVKKKKISMGRSVWQCFGNMHISLESKIVKKLSQIYKSDDPYKNKSKGILTSHALYSVMQSDGNSFCGDVFSDSFNKISRDEDSILYPIYNIKYVRIIIMLILILYNFIRKCILTLQSTKPHS